MRIEIKTYKYRCDRCRKAVVVQREERDNTPPRGWKWHSYYHNSGCMGGGYRELLFCGPCFKINEAVEAKEQAAQDMGS